MAVTRLQRFDIQNANDDDVLIGMEPRAPLDMLIAQLGAEGSRLQPEALGPWLRRYALPEAATFSVCMYVAARGMAQGVLNVPHELGHLVAGVLTCGMPQSMNWDQYGAWPEGRYFTHFEDNIRNHDWTAIFLTGSISSPDTAWACGDTLPSTQSLAKCLDPTARTFDGYLLSDALRSLAGPGVESAEMMILGGASCWCLMHGRIGLGAPLFIWAISEWANLMGYANESSTSHASDFANAARDMDAAGMNGAALDLRMAMGWTLPAAMVAVGCWTLANPAAWIPPSVAVQHAARLAQTDPGICKAFTETQERRMGPHTREAFELILPTDPSEIIPPELLGRATEQLAHNLPAWVLQRGTQHAAREKLHAVSTRIARAAEMVGLSSMMIVPSIRLFAVDGFIPVWTVPVIMSAGAGTLAARTVQSAREATRPHNSTAARILRGAGALCFAGATVSAVTAIVEADQQFRNQQGCPDSFNDSFVGWTSWAVAGGLWTLGNVCHAAANALEAKRHFNGWNVISQNLPSSRWGVWRR